MPKRDEYSERPLERTDSELLFNWRNLDHIRANMYSDHVIARSEHDAWFERILDDPKVCYRIFCHQGRPAGMFCFTAIDQRHQRCTWGFYMGESDVPKGSGAVMEFFALERAFEHMGIRKLCCEVFAFNTAVCRLHQKFGFKQEGLLVKHVLKGEQFEDVVVLALFRDDWLGHVKETVGKVVFRDRSEKPE